MALNLILFAEKGKIFSFFLTKENVDGMDFKVLKSITENRFGKRFTVKEYISKKSSDLFFGSGIHLVAKPTKSMKIVNLSQSDRILGILENVDVLLTPKKGRGCCE